MARAQALGRAQPDCLLVNLDIGGGTTNSPAARAVHENVPHLLPVLTDALSAGHLRCGRPMLARYGRVKLAASLAEALACDLVVLLMGERPGGDAFTATSLSAYFVLNLRDQTARRAAAEFSRHPKIRFEYTVILDIYARGPPPVEASALARRKAGEILEHQAAGNRLEALLARCPRLACDLETPD